MTGAGDEDTDMIQRARVSDEEFRERVEPLLPRAAAYAFAIVRNREDAEDAVQEATLKACLAMDRYDRFQSFKGWFFAIVRNASLDLLRKHRRNPLRGAADIDEAPLATGDKRDGMQLSDAMGWALTQLTPAHREVLELRYFGDCSYQDIAASLDIPMGTVMSRLHAARQALNVVYRKEVA